MMTIADFRLPRKISLEIDDVLLTELQSQLSSNIRLSDAFHYACNETGKFDLYDYFNDSLAWSESDELLRTIFGLMVAKGWYQDDDIYEYL